jgi:hypothetical protein
MSSFLSGRQAGTETQPDIDYYELLRVDPIANLGIATEAYLVMRNYYLRLIEQTGASRELVNALAEGYDIISDPRKRREYDRARKAKRRLSTGTSRRRTTQGEPEPTPSTAEEQTGGKLPPAAEKSVRRQRPSPANGHKPGSVRQSEQGQESSSIEPVSIKIARSLAAGSATFFGRSVKFARKASQTLREALVEDDKEFVPPVMELSPEEEQALLERLSWSPEGAPYETQPAASSTGILAQLSIIEGPGFGRTFEVGAVPFTLGEASSCDVSLPELARQQARLLHRNGQFVLFSLTDEPKTTIHGNSVAWGVLEDGDSFQIGPYVFKFEAPSLTMAGR